MDFSNFEYHKDKVPSDQTEKDKYFEGLEETFINEIKSSEKASEFFNKYSASTVETFIKYYASRRADLAKYYEYYLRLEQNRDFGFREKAELAMQAIKQKKLFNLQLQWRAGSITIKEIQISYDFEFWGKHIESCNFIPPITYEEVELMKEYLKQDNSLEDLGYHTYEWQAYRTLMEPSVNDDEEASYPMPKWYDFYDLHMGTRGLLALPDTCGKKEGYYEDIGRQHWYKQFEEQRKNDPPYVPPLPGIYFLPPNIMDFSNVYETDKYFKNFIQNQ